MYLNSNFTGHLAFNLATPVVEMLWIARSTFLPLCFSCAFLYHRDWKAKPSFSRPLCVQIRSGFSHSDVLTRRERRLPLVFVCPQAKSRSHGASLQPHARLFPASRVLRGVELGQRSRLPIAVSHHQLQMCGDCGSFRTVGPRPWQHLHPPSSGRCALQDVRKS